VNTIPPPGGKPEAGRPEGSSFPEHLLARGLWRLWEGFPRGRRRAAEGRALADITSWLGPTNGLVHWLPLEVIDGHGLALAIPLSAAAVLQHCPVRYDADPLPALCAAPYLWAWQPGAPGYVELSWRPGEFRHEQALRGLSPRRRYDRYVQQLRALARDEASWSSGRRGRLRLENSPLGQLELAREAIVYRRANRWATMPDTVAHLGMVDEDTIGDRILQRRAVQAAVRRLQRYIQRLKVTEQRP
jgi:hypothetical protein